MWISLLVSMWASVAFTIYWLDYARVPDRIQWLNRKPFNCGACLPLYVFVGFYIASIHYLADVAATAGMFTTGIIAPIILKQLNK